MAGEACTRCAWLTPPLAPPRYVDWEFAADASEDSLSVMLTGNDKYKATTRSAGFGASHTVWGSLADDESKEVAQRLVQGKIASHVKPGQMRILDEPVRFTIRDATAG